MSWEAVIGLEVHVHLRTATKMFCRCENRFGAEPNSLVCAVCMGYPGALPVPNHAAVDLATTLALALGCEIRERSIFARKNYFYPDLPKGYQISQYEAPIAQGGALPLRQATAGESRRIRVHRLHLEEDAGKLLHESPGESYVDFNRCGVPLVEIVSEPDLRSAAEAQDYLQTLHQVLLYTGTSDANMEEGSLRCDANVSVRRAGTDRLGTKVEVKNLNSFRFVGRAIEHEIERQTEILESGGLIVQETRSFDEASGTTHPLRSKEEAQDYRYFPDPDLEPLHVDAARVERLRAALPEMPWSRRARYAAALGLPEDEAAFLASERGVSDYLDALIDQVSAAGSSAATARAAAHWVKGPLLAVARERGGGIEAAPRPAVVAAILRLIEGGQLSSGAAKTVLEAVWETGEDPGVAAARLGVIQVSDPGAMAGWVDGVLADHAAVAAEFRAGKTQSMAFLVGQVMKRSAGRADPKRARELLERALAS